MVKFNVFGDYCRNLLPIVLWAGLSFETNPARAIDVTLQQQILPDRQLQAQVESEAASSIDKSDRSSLAQKVLSEINRARTDPQGYAAWLQEQKQYYDGILLKLPGEKPVRTNKGLEALAEAIDFLEQQEPLPNLTISEQLNTTAAAKLMQVSSTETGEDFKNISYGKLTAAGIVMHLIVDDGFPDRRHRTSIFNPNFDTAGITCQDNELYNNICAIAYEGETLDVATQPNVENDKTPPESDTANTLPQSSQSNSFPNSENNSENETNSASNDLPDVPEIQVPTIDANSESESNTNTEDNSPTEASDVVVNSEPEAENISTTELSDTETDGESETQTVPKSESTVEPEGNSSIANLLEKTERGVLEEGDETIPNDGSFYDSYPLQGNAGDSFIISLESQDFDTFVAILDSEGNIIDQNDDINEENSNSRLRITLPSNGVYNVIVNAYDKGGKGRYTLTVRR